MIPPGPYLISEGTRGQEVNPWRACGQHLKSTELARSRHEEQHANSVERQRATEDMAKALLYFAGKVGVVVTEHGDLSPEGELGRRRVLLDPDQLRSLADALAPLMEPEQWIGKYLAEELADASEATVTPIRSGTVVTFPRRPGLTK
jgi:hypothetical protein